MIDREDNKVIAICDNCMDHVESNNWNELMENLKHEGWIKEWNDDLGCWEDFCFECCDQLNIVQFDEDG